MSLILIGGGARSGKSSYALTRAHMFGNRVGLIATAEPSDEEMRNRIERHRQDRSADVVTIEEPLEVAAVITKKGGDFDALVLDCLTLWLTNHLLGGQSDLVQESNLIVSAAKHAKSAVLLVTNEVGCGVVPDTPLGRDFRDLAGRLNQMAATAADEVYWMVFGIPVRVK